MARKHWLAGLAILAVTSPAAYAQQRDTGDELWARPVVSFKGYPSILDMPSAHQMPDADLTIAAAVLGPDIRRYSLSFQITERLSGVFRYGLIRGYRNRDDYYDRSFDLRYQLLEESLRWPAVTVGLQDFGGTGILAGEYLVGTKTFGRLRVTGGLGWGRFGSYKGFENPLSPLSDKFKTRPSEGAVETGQFDADQWFRGDAAFFGGVQYQLNDHLVLSAEYSSDAYTPEVDQIGFERDSPFNFGATYRLDNDLDLSLAWMYGSTLAAGVTFNFNAKAPNKYPSGFEPDGVAVVMRPANAARDLGWAQNIETRDALRDQVRTALSDRDIALDAFEIDARRVQLRIRNGEFPNNAQAVGRVARLLTALMPPSVEIFEITLVSGSGVNGSRVVLLRSDIEELVDEPDGAWQSFARARILDAHPESARVAEVPERFPRFSYALGPYLETAFFDPAAPVRTDVGLQLGSTLELSPGFLLRGNVRYLIAGNRDELPLSGSALPRVRTDGPRYFQEGDGLTLNRLTAEKYFRPAKDLYGHVSVGYFEPMFGGLSGELLWKQVDSPLALGAELNYAVQREFDQGFGFGDYDIVTGHASAYYALENGFHVQVDAGRYLAGDWGATFGLDREFDNGISIGAFATLTDVSSEDFGEGSFDKGIRVTIPFSALIGRNTTTTVSRVIRTVQRDGGARLYVPGRLYDQVREYHQPELQDEWGRFWR